MLEEFQTRFDEWVEQAAAVFQASEDHPLIDDPIVDEAEIYEATFPFLEPFKDKEALPGLLMERLVSSGCSPPVRFVILNLLYLLAAQPDLDTQWSLSVTREWCRAHLVSAVQILDRSMSLLQGPKELRWEIVNFCVIGDWDRAASLYSRLKDLGAISPGEYHALLGEMYLSSVLAPWAKAKHSIDPTELPAFWKPALGSLWGFNQRETSDGMRATLAVLWAFDLSNTESYSDAERERISEAAHHWEQALEMTPSANTLLPVVSAKFQFLFGRYLEAAHSYEHPLKSVQQQPRTIDLDASSEEGGNYLLKLLFNAAECHGKAGDSKSAIDLMEAWEERYSKTKGFYSTLARLHLSEPLEVDLKKVHECLRKEQDADSTFGDDPGTSLALLLGDLAGLDPRTLVRTFAESNPNTISLLDRAVSRHWPQFRSLDEGSQKAWIESAHFLWGSDTISPLTRCGVAAPFAMIAEIELRRLFDEFRREKGPSVLKGALPEWRDDKLIRYLSGGDIQLGGMIREIDYARRSSPRHREFKNWLERRSRGLLQNWDFGRATALAALRNRLHTDEGVSQEEAAQLYDDAVWLISLLKPIPPSKPI